ncbi:MULTISPECIES: YbjN domain-containing protein [Sphingobacterium]|uniref:Molecular chaperone Tir n=1 Tax=Sphingobacterium litopenaei TaxID=2763500 RepID=A0ABR7YAF2_9SPHI|nr:MULTISPECIES: YbjN domain-containing protein [Sphingobacterium]MBD1428286.1 molecular chaperone Tir [Sphingobacterium litopenaei]NGM72151.1 YbjN domain-containing protein [Sphingobacterium sp. SGL-16]
MNFKTVEKFILDLDYTIISKNGKEGFFLIENNFDGIKNLIVGVTPPIIIFEQHLFSLHTDNLHIFKSLLIKNRDIIHGAFALTEDGKRVIFRYTLQLHNLDQNEFDAAINSLSLLLSEYNKQLIQFSKQ